MVKIVIFNIKLKIDNLSIDWYHKVETDWLDHLNIKETKIRAEP